MEEKVKINTSYETLDGEDDVLLLGKATFTVRHLKELTASKFYKIMVQTYIAETNKREQSIIQWIQYLSINEETKIMGGDINWKSPQEGIDCQILKIGSKGWQKGKLKIEVNATLQSWKTQTSIKFCPDEPPEPKSPLDDIRQSEEYKKLSDNK
ncbi:MULTISPECIES: KGK domain-containing protein [unclassified Microcoleus]|uniref:KGK domain-containing protein n=1 Tax=unclassified Microcoleus TaxID=2642155 RepID=UPI001DC7226D|nr:MULTISPECIES: KGK domain-containing protein [unclassified Microcoleus]MCC3443919.1 KGK family protein [Microcoleus sp. PH2017_03_ELD_O_A]MCC3501952.1 KGK family protein [Microcoleus sp. PH2017_19_SFW_U_A]TAF57386.1 MAG: KGK family protein [Oscillatoriales cyanobacterium]MCC3453025.1 KGK family protein [Microcoleus sp. PH2017_08_TRC_O_A]MCC3471993.1 KGK family protein [Microcoleus sp. PH2017_13_LAR_U_A]